MALSLNLRRLQNPADLQGSASGDSRLKAAALVNVSPRLVSHAIKVLHSGSEELIQVVEWGGPAVSAASMEVLEARGFEYTVASLHGRLPGR